MSTTSFEHLLTRLTEERVEYVLIGGVEAVVHGSPYATYDVDVCHDRSRENVEQLARTLAPIHPTLREAPGDLPFQWMPRRLRSA